MFLRRNNKITFLLQWKWAITTRIGKLWELLPPLQFLSYLAFKAGKTTWQSIFVIPLFSLTTFSSVLSSTCQCQAADLYPLLIHLFWARLGLLRPQLPGRRIFFFLNHLTKMIMGPKSLRKYFLFIFFCLANRDQCHFFPNCFNLRLC